MEIPADLIITMADIRGVGHCASGTRTWFREQNFDFADMLKNGISARVMYDTGDAYGQRVVTLKLERLAAERIKANG